jgi:hypothetical protein
LHLIAEALKECMKFMTVHKEESCKAHQQAKEALQRIS